MDLISYKNIILITSPKFVIVINQLLSKFRINILKYL